MKLINASLSAIALAAGLTLAATSQAATSVAWTSPAENSEYTVGTVVNIQGQASANGVIGGGLDLVLVLDSSGSMQQSATSNGITKTRQQWQRDAAIALVNNLPMGTTSVGVVEFDADANVARVLSPLSGNLAALIAAINGVDAAGATNIPAGITLAASQLTGALHTAGRPQHMIVMSDGETTGNVITATQNALLAGVDSVHSVALPGGSITTMQNIASNGNGTFINATSNLQALIDVFSGTAGSLVNLDHVDVTLADGTVLHDVATDAFGNFNVNVNIALGVNTFVADAYGTDGTSASATLHIIGKQPVRVNEASSLGLLALGFIALGFARRRTV